MEMISSGRSILLEIMQFIIESSNHLEMHDLARFVGSFLHEPHIKLRRCGI
jgi:hypothetical protein